MEYTYSLDELMEPTRL